METFTFYSYKGGTGRTLLVANTARYLADLGKRVVALDFDLEAPGLHYKLRTERTAGRTGEVPPERGVVDYLLAASVGGTEAFPLSQYLVRVPLPRTTTGELYLMPAGSAPSGDYWRSLTSLTRGDFFANPDGSGIAACLDLKARIESEIEADFLLIDSRTGITEMAGLATTLLADRVVCLMIDNPESLAGTRAVMRSFGQAPRLGGQGPIGLLPVLSRASRDDDETKRRVLRYLNEAGPGAEEGLLLERIYVLRTDPSIAETERLLLGNGDVSARSPLYQDYLELLRALVTADPALVASAENRRLAVARMKDWLTAPSDRLRHDLPKSFDEEQIEEGIRLGKRQARYADIVVYGGKDRTEALMAIEYVEDLESSEAWQWWEANTNLRCAILIGTDKSVYLPKRIFTRDKRGKKFRERDETAGWFVPLGELQFLLASHEDRHPPSVEFSCRQRHRPRGAAFVADPVERPDADRQGLDDRDARFRYGGAHDRCLRQSGAPGEPDTAGVRSGGERDGHRRNRGPERRTWTARWRTGGGALQARDRTYARGSVDRCAVESRVDRQRRPHCSAP